MFRLIQQPMPTPTLFPESVEMPPITVDQADWGMWELLPWAIQIWNRLPSNGATIIQVVIIVAIVFVFVRLMIIQINKIMEEGDV